MQCAATGSYTPVIASYSLRSELYYGITLHDIFEMGLEEI